MDLRAAAQSPAAFRASVLIDRDGIPCPLAQCIQPWQLADFEALDSAWLSLAGRAPEGCTVQCRRLWSERSRGASKTSDIALQVTWITLSSIREVSGVCVAADADQARILVNAIGKLIRINGLDSILEVTRDKVVNLHTNSTLQVMSSDAGSSYGINPSFVIADEITHWPEGRGSAMWDSIVSSAAKRPSCVFVCITNAGFCADWQWPIREAIRTDPRWRFSRLESPPDWMDADTLAEQARLLPPASYNRLWLNQWQSGSGDSLNPTALRECVTRFGPFAARPHGLEMVIGVDLGIRRDHAAAVAVFVDTSGVEQPFVIAEVLNWNPADFGGEIPLHVVKEGLLALRDRFNYRQANFVIDPYQMIGMGQELASPPDSCTVMMREATAKNRSEEARCLLEIVNNRQLALFPGLLLSDLEKVRVVERPTTGLKLEWPRDASGHCDRGAALASALPIAQEYLRAVAMGEFDDSYNTQRVEYARI